MPSPFPGMDPYLESPTHWSDFHATFTLTWREAINNALPANYVARINELVLKVEPELDLPRKTVGPDVLVGRRFPISSAPAAASSVALAEPDPVIIPNIVHLDPHKEAFIEIYRLPEYELVTVLELLSPTNKVGDGRGQYVAKRESLLEQRINLVELDLIRAGKRLQLARSLPPGDYYAFISRGDRRPECQVYRWTVRNRMPALPVPLKLPDADIQVDLAGVFATAYERGRYDRMVRYDESPPVPSFAGEDAEWVLRTAQATAH